MSWHLWLQIAADAAIVFAGAGLLAWFRSLKRWHDSLLRLDRVLTERQVSLQQLEQRLMTIDAKWFTGEADHLHPRPGRRH